MVWSQFSIVVQFGVDFGNSVLDNSNWDKISHSLTKRITHMWGRWDTPQNFLLAFIDELWKSRKARILKKLKKCWRYHFTHVYQKPQSYEVQFLRYKVRQNFLSFWAIFCLFNPSPWQPAKPRFKKNEKNIWRFHHFKLV